MAMVHRTRRSTEQGSAAYKKSLRKWKLARFGITPEQYDLLLTAQDDVCAICGESCATGRRLTVDHDHSTGLVRALLCTSCNRQLGIFEAFRERGNRYLDAFGNGNPLLSGAGAHDPISGSRSRIGSNNVNAKLTEEQVTEIRKRYAEGDATQRQLAAECGISQINVSRIVRGEYWKHEAERPKEVAPHDRPVA